MLKLILLLVGVLYLFNQIPASANNTGLEVTKQTAPSGNEYCIFRQGDLEASFEVERPKKSDSMCVFSIACAFTDAFGGIDGVYICKGNLHHKHRVSNQFGGAAIIDKGAVQLISTGKGATLTGEFLSRIASKGGSLFQQFLVVTDGQPSTFKDKTLYQRRAIVILESGQTAVFESKTALTLSTFAIDLKALGAKNALYTDMGAWDEGWYRTSDHSTKTIGLDRSKTSKQSNWFIFRKKNTP